jgi:hypothetical protein
MKHVFYTMWCLFLATTPAYSTIQTPAQQTVQPTKWSFKDRVLLKILAFKMKHLDRKSLIFKEIPGECSKIVLKDGNVIEANPETILYKNDILRIIASDGETIFISTGNKTTRPSSTSVSGASDSPSFEGYSIAALVTGICGLLLYGSWLGLAAGICGIVFGYIGMKRINSNPEMYKGKNLARAGLITGIIACALFALAIASVITGAV